MGGLGNWNQVESIRLGGSIERNGMQLEMVVIKKRPDQIRVTISVQNQGVETMQIIRAHDGKYAWTATRRAGAPEMQTQKLSQEAADEMLADTGVLPPLIKFWRAGATLNLLPSVRIKDELHYVVQATPVDSTSSYTFYISEEKNLHLEHLEDELINNGSRGAREAILFAESLVKMLAGNYYFWMISLNYSLTILILI